VHPPGRAICSTWPRSGRGPACSTWGRAPETVARIRASFDRLSASYMDSDGVIAVPTKALLAAGIRD